MNSPIAIIDARSPKQVIEKLAKKFDVVPFITHGITYDAIAGHPDIFFCQGNELIVAPNTPTNILEKLNSSKISYRLGNSPVGSFLQESTHYNCVVTEKYIIHKKKFTDKTIIDSNKDKKYISVPQAYTRCNLLAINTNRFITSDNGIFASLQKQGLESIYICPQSIYLPPYPYGFIGGCLGKHENTIFVNGSLAKHPDGKSIKSFIEKSNLEIVELHDGPLFDGGGIFFINQ